MAEAKNTFSGQVAGTAVAILAAGQATIKWLHIFNTTAAVAYLQLFPIAAGSVTPGTTVPKLSFGIPASSHIVIPMGDGQYMSGQGLSAIGTTTRTGSTGAALDINIGYNG